MANHFIFLILISMLSVAPKLEEDIYDLVIDFQKFTGRAGLLSPLILKTHLNNPENYFNLSDLENIFFDVKFIDAYNESYIFTCNLWISDLEENLVFFCYLKEKSSKIFDGYERKIRLEDYIMYFADKKYKIFSSNYYFVTFTDNKNSLFYSKNQTIDLDEEKDEYNIKFKLGKYYDENGLFLDSIFLDNCKVENIGKEMICKIPRIKLENQASSNKNIEKFNLNCYYLNNDCFIETSIIIKHEKNIVKKDVFVEAIKLLNNDLDCANSIAYETNINDFPILEFSESFHLNFTNST